MENARTLLLATIFVVCISVIPDVFTTVEAKFSLSTLKSNLFSGIQNLPTTAIHSRNLGEFNPCEKYGDGHNLPAGHPCASHFESGTGVIPRLINVLKARRRGGRHPPGVGKHPPGVGKHPPGVGKHPPGVGRHPPGVGKRPPRASGDVRCRRNASLCLDPSKNVFLENDPTATTCCRTRCVSLLSPRQCGFCGNRCRASTGGSTCCEIDRTLPVPAACKDLQTDSDNCGACGTKCAAEESCVAGECIPVYAT